MKSYLKQAAVFFAAGLFFAFLTGCSSLPQNSSTSIDEWKQLNEWSWIYHYYDSSIPLKYHVVKIDLSNPEVKITAFPSDISKKQFDSSFITVNTTPYSKKTPFNPFDYLHPAKIIGIHIADGKTWSQAVERYSAIVFYKKTGGGWLGKIIKNQNPRLFSDADFAFGGFFTILEDGIPQTFAAETFDSRTAMGLSSDGSVLYIFCAEGKDKSISKGLSYQETAKIMAENFAVTDALQMDGGYSTSLTAGSETVISRGKLRRSPAFAGFSK